MDLNAHLDPFTGHHISVAFVFAGEVLAQLKPWPVRIGNVLRGMVAPHLIFGAPVGGPHIEAFIVGHVCRIRVQTEGHTDEAARCTAFSVLLGLTCVDYIQAGQTLLSYVRTDSTWVVANYKETQVTKLNVGQKVKLQVDGFGSKEFDGIVSAIAQATGSKFSAIPTDNSTGNFIKVQQRVPVKIEIIRNQNNEEFIKRFRAGMNVEVRIAK